MLKDQKFNAIANIMKDKKNMAFSGFFLLFFRFFQLQILTCQKIMKQM